MSHKIAKRLRKEKRMEDQNKQSPYSFQQLENLIILSVIFTGKKPASLELTPTCYNWFIQEAQRHAETLGLKPGFANDQPVFDGVLLTKQGPAIITPKN